jgi:flagellin FlaB
MNKCNIMSEHTTDKEKIIITIAIMTAIIISIIGAIAIYYSIGENDDVLSQRAQSVGTQTMREVSSGIIIQDITGYTNENRTKIQYLAILVRPRAGSNNTNLTLVNITLLYNNLSELNLNVSRITAVNTDNKTLFNTPLSSGSNQSIFDNLTAFEYGIIAIHDYDDSVINTKIMNSGDRVYFVLNLSAIIPETDGLPARQEISGEIQPETGAPGVYDVTAPAVYSNRFVDLW